MHKARQNTNESANQIAPNTSSVVAIRMLGRATDMPVSELRYFE